MERCATTPERFLQAVADSAPFPWPGGDRAPATARGAFDTLRAFFDTARAPGGGPCIFLLDEVLELRTFESFPGLRHVLRELIESLSASPNRFVLTTRYVSRAHRLLRDATSRFEVMHLPPMSAPDVTDLLAPAFNGYEQMPTDDRDYLGRTIQALTDGRVVYVRAIGEMMGHMGRSADPISALTALLTADGALTHWCRFCYELRLHRARGYGALKAILDILAGEEPLTLTEISLRLRRTPGLDQGLSFVAGGRRPRHVTAEAIRLRRPAAAAVGAPALPPHAARRRGRRQRSAALRARAGAAAGARRGARLRGRRRVAGRAERLGNHRD